MNNKPTVIYRKYCRGRTQRNRLVFCEAPFTFSDSVKIEIVVGEKRELFRLLLLYLADQFSGFWDTFIAYNNPIHRHGSNIRRVYVSRNREDIRGRAEEIVPGIFIETIFGASTDFFSQACRCVGVPLRECPAPLDALLSIVKDDASKKIGA